MAKYFRCNLNKPALSYQAGEPMLFLLSAAEDGKEISCKKFKWTLRGDDGQIHEGIGQCEKGKNFVLRTECFRPGFVHLTCIALSEDGTPDQNFDVCDAGAGADVQKLRYHDTVPSDFDAYWGEIEAMIDGFTPRLLEKTPYTCDVPEGFDCFDVKISTPLETPASGYLSLPKGTGPFPLIISFRGYSVVGAQPSFTKNAIHLNLNAHGIENGLKSEEYALKYPQLAEYGFRIEENTSPYTTYWRNMMIRNLTALKFLKTLPEWNKKDLEAHGGSQGALQATTCAAHDKDVTFLDILVPWFCDLNAESDGYMQGWRPSFARGLRYFDTAAQATRVKCPVRISARLGDYVCPPATVMTLYHNFYVKKSIEFIQSGTHGYLPPEIEKFTLFHDPAKPEEEILPGRYRHFKGKEYQVLFTAKNSETLENMVVYKALYGTGDIWVRPASMWNELVSLGDRQVYRFTFLSET